MPAIRLGKRVAPAYLYDTDTSEGKSEITKVLKTLRASHVKVGSAARAKSNRRASSKRPNTDLQAY